MLQLPAEADKLVPIVLPDNLQNVETLFDWMFNLG